MYIDGFVIPVPTENRERYRDFAARALPIFREHGATRVVECWGTDVPDGKVTDFRGAVKAEPGESVVFAWIEWPSKEVRDAGMARVMEDDRAEALGEMPFVGQRMIFGGFEPIVEG
ncbi:DUF1428 domain-containing protein [Mangrovibrevibacter kandeliae]|uniref:DUF1428 domain-containing protein n=1 Tax=Mangrovibrevibacter kandeliae TaxID=2968473 RepID=UPI0021193C50|nr:MULTISPECIES: DUF1428 domain-containing protein [unclassified Aurantimonas]MCQ8783700.1 DUF1428 domain-containing protein [Aurantimonas sp. CSK15Z-1]MCW4116337.1 DUF1428 domain-containing protein [Aurantimonas sp. MSK8Z-1]